MIVPGRLRRFAQIVPLPRVKLCAICHIDKWVVLWYNISVKRAVLSNREAVTVHTMGDEVGTTEKFLKKFSKTS